MALMKRSDLVAFYQIPSSTISRMTNFMSLSKSHNPKEYSRQYVDEQFEQSDVVGYSPSTDYEFDRYTESAVHTDIAEIGDKGKTGSDAVRDIIVVDFSKASGAGYVATKRSWSVIPDSEGGSTDAMTYSGSFKSKSAPTVGVATSSDGWKTITFTPNTGAEFLVTFNVSALSGQIAGAQVVINSQILVTNATGIASIYLPAATYAYSVIKTGYTTATSSVTVSTAAVYKTQTIVLA